MRAVAVLAAALAAASLTAQRRLVDASKLVRLPAGVGAAAAASGLVWLATTSLGTPVAISAAASTLVAPLPLSLRRSARRRAAAREAARWPDFLAALRARLATGASLPESTRAAARHLGGRFLDLDRGPGEPFADALERIRAKWRDAIADRVLTTLVIAAEVGGHQVDSILGALSVSISDELRLRRAHDSALTQQRLTAAVALVAPWVMLGLSIATNPTASDAYSTPTGGWIVAGGLIATVAGYGLAMRSARLAEPPRTFT